MLVPDFYVLVNRGWTDKPQERYYGGFKDRSHAEMTTIAKAARFETRDEAEKVAKNFTLHLDAIPVTCIIGE